MGLNSHRLSQANRVRRAVAAAVALAVCSVASAGSFLEVRNTSEVDVTLSDLIAQGKNGEKKTILALNDSADDIIIPSSGVRTFDAGFEVASYFISRTARGKEFETLALEVKQKGFKPLGWLQNFADGAPLAAALDYDVAVPPPSEGAVLTFANGVSAQLPGWFVGTGIDLNQGTVTGAFGGQAEVVLTGIEVAAVPEPTCSTIALIILGMLALNAARQRTGPKSLPPAPRAAPLAGYPSS